MAAGLGPAPPRPPGGDRGVLHPAARPGRHLRPGLRPPGRPRGGPAERHGRADRGRPAPARRPRRTGSGPTTSAGTSSCGRCTGRGSRSWSGSWPASAPSSSARPSGWRPASWAASSTRCCRACMDLVLSFPFLLAAIALVSVVGPSLTVIIVVIALFSLGRRRPDRARAGHVHQGEGVHRGGPLGRGQQTCGSCSSRCCPT